MRQLFKVKFYIVGVATELKHIRVDRTFDDNLNLPLLNTAASLSW